MNYGSPHSGIDTLRDEEVHEIKKSGFARLDFTQLPTPNETLLLPPDLTLGKMLAADDGMPPLTIDLVFPGRSVVVHTPVMILAQGKSESITTVRWMTYHESIDKVRNELRANASTFGFSVSDIDTWYHRESVKHNQKGIIARGQGEVGILAEVDYKRTQNGATLWYIAHLNPHVYKPQELAQVRSLPNATVLDAPRIAETQEGNPPR